MTVCKSVKRVDLVPGQAYKKSELLANMQKPEYMASHFYDPPRALLYSFFSQSSDEWQNQYDRRKNTFRYRLSSGKKTKSNPSWERTLIRHVFYNHSALESSQFEYLGSSIDEQQSAASPNSWIVLTLKRQ